MPVIVPTGPPKGADECTIEITSSAHTAAGHQIRFISSRTKPAPASAISMFWIG